MATKGASNRYGNSNGAGGKGLPTKHIGYQYAKDYNKHRLQVDFVKHGEKFGVSTEYEYASHAIHFANVVDRKNNLSFIDSRHTTHKYNLKTNTYVVVDKNGYVVTFFKPSQGIMYYCKKYKEMKK